MKKTTIFLSTLMLSTLPLAASAFDLVGTWCVDMHSNYSQGTTLPAELDVHERYDIEIQDQGKSGFYGRVWADPPGEYTYFSGVLDGKDIYFTHWDSATTGRLGKGGKEITFVNQAFDADDRSAKTSIGLATKGMCPP